MRPLGLLGLALLAAAAAPAATLEVRFEPGRFGVEDVAGLVVRLADPPAGSGDAVEVELGALDNLEVVGGPSRGSEFRFVNGVSSQSISFTYRVRGLAAGVAAVGPVSLRLGDEVLSSGRITAEIVEGSVLGRERSRPRPFDPFADMLGRPQAVEGRLALRHLVSSRSVVLGEPVVVSVVLDSTVPGIEGFEWVQPPSYPGWWAQRVDVSDRREPEVVEFEGRPAARYLVDRHVLIPLRGGELGLPAATARIGFRGRSLLAPPQVVERTTGEVAVAVAERPTPPGGFFGAVGALTYRLEVEPLQLELGQPVQVTITLEGDGNLPLVEAPTSWPRCEGCELYPPEEDSEVVVHGAGIRGRRQWRSTLLPRVPGTLALSPVTLAVYAPRDGGYRSSSFDGLVLEVAPPPSTSSTLAQDGPETDLGGPRQAEEIPASSSGLSLPWLSIVVALMAGLVVGGAVTGLMARRRISNLPPRRPGQSPSERARELQLTLERWWLDARGRPRADQLRPEMDALRRELEAVRFAPGRADHTDTVADLEDRLRRLLRRP